MHKHTWVNVRSSEYYVKVEIDGKLYLETVYWNKECLYCLKRKKKINKVTFVGPRYLEMWND